MPCNFVVLHLHCINIFVQMLTHDGRSLFFTALILDLIASACSNRGAVMMSNSVFVALPSASPISINDVPNISSTEIPSDQEHGGRCVQK